jgi:hypothetical protein
VPRIPSTASDQGLWRLPSLTRGDPIVSETSIVPLDRDFHGPNHSRLGGLIHEYELPT